jgi:hypothetical protein
MENIYWLLSTGDTWRLSPQEDGTLIISNETNGSFVGRKPNIEAARETVEKYLCATIIEEL